MESECTTVFGVALGDWMSEQWNRRQRAGDIAGLKQLATCRAGKLATKRKGTWQHMGIIVDLSCEKS